MRLIHSVPAAAVLALAAITVSAQSLPPQRVAPASTIATARQGGIDGPFIPTPQAGVEAARTDSTGDTLEGEAQQRITTNLGANGVLAHRNAITKQQAQAHGLGFVATHLEQIDRTGSGRVTLEDVEVYLRDQRRK